MPWVTKDSNEQYDTTAPGFTEPEREYTKKEKAANWWHYHKWVVLGSIAALIAVVWLVKDTVFQVKPDYQIAYVGQSDLPLDTAEALTAALEQFCDDRNGDGQVVLQLNQYILDMNPETDNVDAYTQMASMTRLSTDLSSNNGSYIYIVENAQQFENTTLALRYLDGTLPDVDIPEDEQADLDWENMVYRWTDCPVLAGLELGSFTGYTMLDDTPGDSQALLQDFYVGCRGMWNDEQTEGYAKDEVLWQALTAGATALPEATR